MLVRQPMGLEQYEVDGRPDGLRPHGMESVLDFQLERLAAAKRAGAEEALRLSAKDCAELFNEGTIYYYRFIHFFRVKEWVRAERDTARTLRLIEFVERCGEHEEDRAQLEQWRTDVARIHAVARVMVLLRSGQYEEGIKIARETITEVDALLQERGGARAQPEEVAAALFDGVRVSLTNAPTLRQREESVFVRQGDYWTIQYQGQVARLKATRALHCLACLLRHPGREFHVCELIAAFLEVPVATAVARNMTLMASRTVCGRMAWNPHWIFITKQKRFGKCKESGKFVTKSRSRGENLASKGNLLFRTPLHRLHFRRCSVS